MILSPQQPDCLPAIAQFGWTGVDLFFVLSGFLIASQLFEQINKGGAISSRQFFTKRFFRILPAYWLTLAFYFCLPFFREKESLPPLWKFLTFTQNFGLNLATTGTFSHAWSLCVEEHFYLLLPVVVILLLYTNRFKIGWWLLPGLFAAGFAWRAYSYHCYNSATDPSAVLWYQYVYYPTYNRLDGLLVGVSIAAVYRFLPATWNTISRYGNWLIAAGVLVLAVACRLCADPQSWAASIFGFPVIALGYGLVVAGAVSETSVLYKWQSKVTTLIATLSYAVYLTHKGVVHVTQQVFGGAGLSPAVLLLVCIVSCMAAAYLLHRLVERPFMQLRDRFLKQAQAKPTAPWVFPKIR